SRPVLNCAGGGTCATCMVEIIEGKELLSLRTDKEKLKRKPKKWRLACQTTVGKPDSTGLVVIQQLPEWKGHEWTLGKLLSTAAATAVESTVVAPMVESAAVAAAEVEATVVNSNGTEKGQIIATPVAGRNGQPKQATEGAKATIDCRCVENWCINNEGHAEGNIASTTLAKERLLQLHRLKCVLIVHSLLFILIHSFGEFNWEKVKLGPENDQRGIDENAV
ncbi:hypothetical protein M8C21_002394, partial [Ambrosia artemisiifolia]